MQSTVSISGFFKMLRGVDECGIQRDISAGEPKIVFSISRLFDVGGVLLKSPGILCNNFIINSEKSLIFFFFTATHLGNPF